MSNYELRRLELKSRFLKQEVLCNEIKRRELGTNLRLKEQATSIREKTWSKFLRETLNSYRAAALPLKSEILGSGLKILSASSKLIEKSKNEQQLLKSRLEQLVETATQKDIQLQQCYSRKKSKIETKDSQEEQNLQDDLVILKSIKTSNLNSKSLFSSEGLEESLERENEQLALSESQTQHNFQTTLKQNNIIRAGDRLPNDIHSPCKELQMSISRNKWQQAKKSQDEISQMNEKLKVSLLQTHSGTSLGLDYCVAPGRLFSITASKSSTLAGLSLNIGVNSLPDLRKLKSEQRSIVDNLVNQKIDVKEFRAFEK